MALSITETKSLSRHFLIIAKDQGLDEDAIVALLPIKSFYAFGNWILGACRMQGPSAIAIKELLRGWGKSEDPQASVNAYFTMAQELSHSQRWELVTLLLEDLRNGS